ncbi:hypothetical protein BC938DRAFT_474075 [Jimgerdemannia flammicorona]|uniref:Rieske domain-containing protein n=1 Tax=Jimgerdemannia flammicorona TaxID=994334 RepID=A0A433QSX1_9FUNG|nr:hypothetical protein BC938DRAFT_474075 [Jimgerdemannia flammicorona]
MSSSRFEPTIKYRSAKKPTENEVSAVLSKLNLGRPSPAAVSGPQMPTSDQTPSSSSRDAGISTAASNEDAAETKVGNISEPDVAPKPTPIPNAWSSSSSATPPANPPVTINLTPTPSTPPTKPFTPPEPFSSQISIDPSDKERIVVTLSDGRRYGADRYCPHNGADMAHVGEVIEDEYGPEIGPILLCPLHYWEYALERGGMSGGGWATVNACKIEGMREKGACKGASEKCKATDW